MATNGTTTTAAGNKTGTTTATKRGTVNQMTARLDRLLGQFGTGFAKLTQLWGDIQNQQRELNEAREVAANAKGGGTK